MKDSIEFTPARRFTLVTLLQPMEAEIAELKQFFKSIKVDKAFKAMRRYDYKSGCVEVRILYLNDDLSLGQWLARFPSASVRVWYFDVNRLHEVFKEKLLEPYVPRDGAERGRQEVLFNKTQRFAAIGIKQVKTPTRPENSLFTEETEVPVNNAYSPDLVGQDCGMGKCPHGCFYNQRTKWHDPGEPIPPEGFVEYERVPPLPIQH